MSQEHQIAPAHQLMSSFDQIISDLDGHVPTILRLSDNDRRIILDLIANNHPFSHPLNIWDSGYVSVNDNTTIFADIIKNIFSPDIIQNLFARINEEDDHELAEPEEYSDLPELHKLLYSNTPISIAEALALLTPENINAEDDMERNAFHIACMMGQTDVVQAILAINPLPFNIDEVDSKGFAAIHYATMNNHAQIVEQILRKFPNSVNLSTSSNEEDQISPAFIAVKVGAHAALAKILAHNPTLEEICLHGLNTFQYDDGLYDEAIQSTPLHQAIEKKDLVSFGLLIKHNPSLLFYNLFSHEDSMSDDSETDEPKNMRPAYELLHDIEVDDPQTYNQMLALVVAAISSKFAKPLSEDNIQLLLQFRDNAEFSLYEKFDGVNSLYSNLISQLSYNASDIERLKQIIRTNDMPDKSGINVLHQYLVAENFNIESFSEITAIARVEALSLNGGTLNLSPLHLALYTKNNAAAQNLITRGSNQTSKDIAGRTPLHIAYMTNSPLAPTILAQIDLGDVSSNTDNLGKTPLCYAIDSGNPQNIIDIFERFSFDHKKNIPTILNSRYHDQDPSDIFSKLDLTSACNHEVLLYLISQDLKGVRYQRQDLATVILQKYVDYNRQDNAANAENNPYAQLKQCLATKPDLLTKLLELEKTPASLDQPIAKRLRHDRGMAEG